MRHAAWLALWVALASITLASPVGAAVDRTTIEVRVIWYDPANSGFVYSPFTLELYDELAPKTVDNFKNYIYSGEYQYSLIHRSAHSGGTPFVIQGGGFWASEDPDQTISIYDVTSFGNIDSEFDAATMSNVRGTLAMARIGNDENSATSEWFINESDNTFLDYADNPNVVGFTVFGEVVNTVADPGMDLVDAIGSLPTFNFSSPPTDPAHGALGEIPLLYYGQADYNALTPLTLENLIYTDMVILDTPVLGDVNRDDVANNLDIAAFIGVLTNPAHPYQPQADLNRDKIVNNLDIAHFIQLLTSASGAGSGSPTVVPEPASLSLLLGATLLYCRRRR